MIVAPNVKFLDRDFLVITFITVGVPLLLLPLLSMNKSQKFYKKAEHENKIRRDNERIPSPVEEEYKNDSLVLGLLLSFLLLIMTYFLWKN